MAHVLTNSEKAVIDAELKVLRNAELEYPLNERTAKQLARVAKSSGFTATESAFVDDIHDRPLHTLISFARFLGA